MCEMLDRIEAKGEANGVLKGSVNAFCESVMGIVQKFHISIEEAMDIANVPDSLREDVRNRIIGSK